MPSIPNVLAQRYATPDMTRLWSAEGKVLLEREFWIAVMKAQRDLGVPIPADAIKDYEKVKDQIDLAAIAQRELPDLDDAAQQLLSWNLHLAARRTVGLLPSDVVFTEPPPAR